MKKAFFPDAIYCIDELETHLHTRVQGALLREIVKILPDRSQLWITTHSLGVLRAGLQLEADSPASVCVLDFDGVEPDEPREIVPSSLGRVTWEKLLSIALDDLSYRVAPRVVVVCEGSSIGTRRRDFDVEIYNRILGSQVTDVLFVSGGSSGQLAASGTTVSDTLRNIVPSAKVIRICDRDDKSDHEVSAFERSGDIVLSRRNLESFLFEDDVISALVARENKASLLGDALLAKADAIGKSIGRGNPADDLKSAAGDIYVSLKQLLELRRGGNSADAFMRDTLAPLIVPGMKTFDDMKHAILDRI